MKKAEATGLLVASSLGEVSQWLQVILTQLLDSVVAIPSDCLTHEQKTAEQLDQQKATPLKFDIDSQNDAIFEAVSIHFPRPINFGVSIRQISGV